MRGFTCPEDERLLAEMRRRMAENDRLRQNLQDDLPLHNYRDDRKGGEE